MKTIHDTSPILLPPALVAKRWNRHVMTIRRMIRTGELPSVRVGCRKLISLATIEAIESAGKPRAPIGAVSPAKQQESIS
jgi:excisionase family DNA binding protein